MFDRLPLIFAFLFPLTDCFVQAKHQRLLVAEYRIDSTTVGDYTFLVAYNFTDGELISKDTILGAETSRGTHEGSYVRYDIGQLIYNTNGDEDYLVDTAKKILSPYINYEFGSGFSRDSTWHRQGQTIFYKNKLVGRHWYNHAVVADEIIAFEYGSPGSNLAYPKGFKVWHAKTNKWTVVDVPWLCTIIGWMEGE